MTAQQHNMFLWW